MYTRSSVSSPAVQSHIHDDAFPQASQSCAYEREHSFKASVIYIYPYTLVVLISPQYPTIKAYICVADNRCTNMAGAAKRASSAKGSVLGGEIWHHN